MLQAACPNLPNQMAIGIVSAMTLKIDKLGRLVIPKPVRERLRLKPNARLEAVEQPDGILLRPLHQKPSMIQVNGLWVHTGKAEPAAKWDKLIDEIREERVESVLKPL